MNLSRLILPLLVLCFAFAAPVQSGQSAIPADRIVAVVNTEAITLSELKSRLANVERQARAQNTQLPAQDVLQRQMLEKMISDKVQIQLAKDTGLEVPDAELDAAMGRIADNNKMSMGTFKEALVHDGIDWSKFREEIREQIIMSHLRERDVESRVVISDGEVDNYLANPISTDEVGQVAIAHVLVRAPEQASPEQLTKLHTKAEQALAQVNNGEDFGKVAASFSDAPDALSGGVIAMRPISRLPALYAEAVQKLKPGEVSPLMRSPVGFHFIKLLERKGGELEMPSMKQTHARHILIKVNEVVSDLEAKHKLEGLKERLDNGTDFAELARLYSSDLSAVKGGDLGWLNQGDTVPDFEKAMDGLAVKEISQPVKSPFGWHLIQVLERRTDEGSPERKRLAARQVLRERRSDEMYQDWQRQLRDRAYVEYHLEDQ